VVEEDVDSAGHDEEEVIMVVGHAGKAWLTREEGRNRE